MGRNLSVVHEITTDDQGARHGTDGTRTVTLLGTEGRMFKRRAVKNVPHRIHNRCGPRAPSPSKWG